MTPAPHTSHYESAVKAFAMTQKLTVKAFNAKDLDNLIFIILNDTYQALSYDRAILFSLSGGKCSVLGVSGQATYTESAELLSHLKTLVASLKKPEEPRVLKDDELESEGGWKYLQAHKKATVFWSAFTLKDGTVIGLWLEKWEDQQAEAYFRDNAPLLTEFLLKGYAAAWERLQRTVSWMTLKTRLNTKTLFILSGLFLLALFFIPVRLRIVAPCEVVARDPYIVTAPLPGVIESIAVEPGMLAQEGDLLYSYDGRIPLQEYKVAQKERDMVQAEIKQAFASGVSEPKQLYQLASLNLRLKKAQLNLDFAAAQLKLLEGKALQRGIVVMEDPDSWSGKPVKIGEKIMVLSDPHATKVKIWIPEKDNIPFDRKIPVKVFLNPHPATSLPARLLYISNSVTFKDSSYPPSFTAVAEWTKEADPAELGLKGSAVLYGEKVSLFYYLFRKPLLSLRVFLGL